jgi:pyridoxamine 5'-phosphate oxidase
MKDLQDIRQDYLKSNLSEENISENPFVEFASWFSNALKNSKLEPNAMVLSTVSKSAQPSARVVLLKVVDETGFVFFTNYESRKGKELTECPLASLLFFWSDLEQQIRIEGKVERISEEESEAYYHSRPRGSQIGAWASPQSQVIPNREFLEEKVEKYSQEFQNEEVIPYPKFWGGFRLVPHRIEFWQGRSSRLHDRIVFEKGENGNWNKSRLAP